MKGVPFPLLFSFLVETYRIWQNAAFHGAFRGDCCAVMATKLNSLFHVFHQMSGHMLQMLCNGGASLIFMSSLWRVCNLISKTKWPTEDLNGDFSDLNLIFVINLGILDGIQFFILPYFLHCQDGTSYQTQNFIKQRQKIHSVHCSEVLFSLLHLISCCSGTNFTALNYNCLFKKP